MQILIRHKIQDTLVLPINYHHIIQSIIYHNMEQSFGYNHYMHEVGMGFDTKKFKLFTFGPLQGPYKLIDKKIVFYKHVEFEVRSPDLFMLRMLVENIRGNGVRYGNQIFSDVEIYVADTTVEEEMIQIKMQAPLTAYRTDEITKKTYFYSPVDEEFEVKIRENFQNKYYACYGVMPGDDLKIECVKVTEKDKCVTKYKGFYINGWRGIYNLHGQRKYLDFLYQAGLGGKNAQGFGMFDII